jgi:hypothetical protein
MALNAEERQDVCPECGAYVTTRRTRIGFTILMPAFQVKLGPEHDRRCIHWRRVTPGND